MVGRGDGVRMSGETTWGYLKGATGGFIHWLWTRAQVMAFEFFWRKSMALATF
jgi:hypothetical protein